MKDDDKDRSRRMRWALPASFVVHFVAALLLVFGLPAALPKPPDDQAVSVQIVPPPKPPAQAAAAATEKKPEPRVESAPKKEGETVAPPLDAVVRYGEKDAGPRKALDGSGAENGTAADGPPADASTPDDAKTPETTRPEEAAAKPDHEPETRDAKPEQTSAAPSKDDIPALIASSAPDDQHAPTATEKPAPAPKPKPNVQSAASPPQKLRQARKLFSQSSILDPVATAAMAGIPRGVRAERLCVTELREQLSHSSPSYVPDLLPSYKMREGTVLDVPKAAFRAAGKWYDLAFRCTLDDGVTRIVSFALRVGAPVPRDQWAARGLPAQ